MLVRIVVGCAALLAPLAVSAQGTSLQDARKGFKTKLLKTTRTKDDLPRPPRGFTIVQYPTALGPMKALLTPPRDPKTQQPAMVWITGGFPSGGIGESAWKAVDPKNDQSAKAYRHAGLVMMYPTLRGSYGNPGVQEAFLGEVDDVLAAVEYLSKLEYVDPKQIYLGGHSTGGTLALLVAAASPRFKAVISRSRARCSFRT